MGTRCQAERAAGRAVDGRQILPCVAESMAGRAAVLQRLPLSSSVSPKASVLRGGDPGVVACPSGRAIMVSLLRAEVPRGRYPRDHRRARSCELATIFRAARITARHSAQQDGAGGTVGRFGTWHDRVAECPRNHRTSRQRRRWPGSATRAQRPSLDGSGSHQSHHSRSSGTSSGGAASRLPPDPITARSSRSRIRAAIPAGTSS